MSFAQPSKPSPPKCDKQRYGINWQIQKLTRSSLVKIIEKHDLYDSPCHNSELSELIYTHLKTLKVTREVVTFV